MIDTHTLVMLSVVLPLLSSDAVMAVMVVSTVYSPRLKSLVLPAASI